MAGVSTESRDALVETFSRRFAADANATISSELFAVASLADRDGTFRRALTDPSREAQQRRGIAARVLDGKVYPAVKEMVGLAAASRWSAERDLADALEHLAVLAAAETAEHRGGSQAVDEVAADLLRFAHAVGTEPELQRALSDQRATAEVKRTLVSEAIPMSTPEGRDLIDQVVSHPRGVLPAALAERFAEILTALNQRSIAKVTVSSALDQRRRDRLAAVLSSIYGREMTLDVTVDPQVIGGIKIQVGDEVIDGTVTAKVSELSRALQAQ